MSDTQKNEIKDKTLAPGDRCEEAKQLTEIGLAAVLSCKPEGLVLPQKSCKGSVKQTCSAFEFNMRRTLSFRPKKKCGRSCKLMFQLHHK